jgi:dTMP kinase
MILPMPTEAPDHAWVRKLTGKFIVFDGPDGSGKSTQFRRFANFLHQHGLTVCEVREPGGTILGEQIRKLLLDPAHDMMDMHCEMMLYMASRAQLVAERIRPAMNKGELVLADRFVSSTLAYQGTAGGISADEILQVAKVAVGHCWPNLVVIFDVDEQTAARRLNPLLDRIELRGSEYHRRVRQGYLSQATNDPQGHLVIDARPGPDEVFAALCSGIQQKLAI